jgi:hypothetical protein
VGYSNAVIDAVNVWGDEETERTSRHSKKPDSPQVAIDYIDILIQGQRKTLKDMFKLVERAESFASMRRGSNNKLGLQVSLNQVQKYGSCRDLTVSAIQDLDDLLNEIDSSCSFAPAGYKERATEILERKPNFSPSFILQKASDETADTCDGTVISEISVSVPDVLEQYDREHCVSRIEL